MSQRSLGIDIGAAEKSKQHDGDDDAEDFRHQTQENNLIVASVLSNIAGQLSLISNSVTRSPGDMHGALMQALASSAAAAAGSGGDVSNCSFGADGTESTSQTVSPVDVMAVASGRMHKGPSFGSGCYNLAEHISNSSPVFGTHAMHLASSGQHQHPMHGHAATQQNQHDLRTHYQLAKFVSKAAHRCVAGRDSAGMPVFKAWRGNCAIILADLSGYSRIASHLAPLGAHALSSAVNAVFSTIVGILTDFGGDVIFYAGDAAAAIFCDPVRSAHGDRRACVRAVRAAAKLRSIASPIPKSDLTFRLHIAISFGPVVSDCVAVLGANSSAQKCYPWVEDDIRGGAGAGPMAQIGNMIDLAKVGEVVVSALVKCHTDDVANYTQDPPPVPGVAEKRPTLPPGFFLLESVDEEDAKAVEQQGSDLEDGAVDDVVESMMDDDPLREDDDDDDDDGDGDDEQQHHHQPPNNNNDGGGVDIEDGTSVVVNPQNGAGEEGGKSAGSGTGKISPSLSKNDSSSQQSQQQQQQPKRRRYRRQLPKKSSTHADDELIFGNNNSNTNNNGDAPKRGTFQLAATAAAATSSFSSASADFSTNALFVPPMIIQRIKQGVPIEHQSEMRFLAVMFVVKNSAVVTTRDFAHEVLKTLSPYAACVSILCDDKGSSVVAAVNLTRSECYSCDVALVAAAALEERMSDSVKIGIAAGYVLAGVTGGGAALRQDICGVAVVRACRLAAWSVKAQHRMPGQTGGIITPNIVIDKSVQVAVSDTTRLAHLAKIVVKGTPEPIQIFCLARSRTTYLNVLTDVVRKSSKLLYLNVQETLMQVLGDKNLQQVGCVVVAGASLQGKKSVVVNAVDRFNAEVRRVNLLHNNNNNKQYSNSRPKNTTQYLVFRSQCQSRDGDEPLRIAESFSAYFRFYHDPEIARLARDLEVQHGRNRLTRSQALLSEICRLLILRGEHVAMVVTASQYIDPSSLSFIANLCTQQAVYDDSHATVAAAAAASGVQESHAHFGAAHSLALLASNSADFFVGGDSAVSRSVFRRRRAQGRICIFLTHTPMYGAHTVDDLRGVLGPSTTTVELPPLTIDQTRDVFRASSGFGCDSKFQQALRVHCGASPAFVAASASYIRKTLFSSAYSDLVNKNVNNNNNNNNNSGVDSTFALSSADYQSQHPDVVSILLSCGYYKITAEGSKKLVDGTAGEGYSGVLINTPDSFRPWRETSGRLYTRVAFVFDCLPPRLQLILRVVAAITYKREIRRWNDGGVPVPVLQGTIRRLQGSSSHSAASGLARDLEKLEELKLVDAHSSEPALGPAPCARILLPALIEAVYALLPPDTVLLYNRRAAAEADRYFFSKDSNNKKDNNTSNNDNNGNRETTPTSPFPSTGNLDASTCYLPDASKLDSGPSAARQNLILAQMFVSSGQREKALSCIRDGWNAVLAEYPSERDTTTRPGQVRYHEQRALYAYRYSTYAEKLLGNPTKKDLIRFFFPEKMPAATTTAPIGGGKPKAEEVFDGATSMIGRNAMNNNNNNNDSNNSSNAFYDPAKEALLPSPHAYNYIWHARATKHSQFMGMMHPIVVRAAAVQFPIALGTICGILQLLSRNALEFAVRAVTTRVSQHLSTPNAFIALFPLVDETSRAYLANATRTLDDLLLDFATPAPAPLPATGATAQEKEQHEKQLQARNLSAFQQQQIQAREREHIEAMVRPGQSEAEYCRHIAVFLRDCEQHVPPRVDKMRDFAERPAAQTLVLKMWQAALLDKNSSHVRSAQVIFQALLPFFTPTNRRLGEKIQMKRRKISNAYRNLNSNDGDGENSRGQRVGDDDDSDRDDVLSLQPEDDDDVQLVADENVIFEQFEESLMVLAHNSFQLPFVNMSLRQLRDLVIANDKAQSKETDLAFQRGANSYTDYKSFLMVLFVVRMKLGPFIVQPRAESAEDLELSTTAPGMGQEKTTQLVPTPPDVMSPKRHK